MLDLGFLRTKTQQAIQACKKRGYDASVITEILEKDALRRAWGGKSQTLRQEHKKRSQEMYQRSLSQKQKQGEKMEAIKSQLKAFRQKETVLSDALNASLLALPNLPDEDVPEGFSTDDGSILETWGEPVVLTSPSHQMLTDDIDMVAGARISGGRFALLKGAMARLERALKTMMLTFHQEAGYEEISPPFLVHSQSLEGGGQLPKFAQEQYQTRLDDLWLIPTGETPLVNRFRGTILPEQQLPVRMVASTPCFRREAGATSKKTHGLIRLHQFAKVEIVSLTTIEQEEQEMARKRVLISRLLQRLDLPYRIRLLPAGDMAFSARKTYDFEVWMPSHQDYVEISSLSSCGTFQGRRTKTRYRSSSGGLAFIATLNASGLAVGRTMAALIENHRRDDRLDLPEGLVPFYGEKFLMLKSGDSA